jgi:hypothetical protein
VLDRIGLAPRQALAAGEVVEHAGVRMGLDQLAAAVGGLRVLAGLVERVDRRPRLPAARLVGLARRPAERDDRRPRLLGERPSLISSISSRCATA